MSISTVVDRESSARHVCTGVLILPDVVLTAAHCLTGYDPRELQIIVDGESVPSKISSSANPAFMFNGFTGHNDLSLVFLEKCVTGIVRFPKLSTGSEESVCKPVEGLGFGRSEQIPPSLYVPDGKLRSVRSNQYIHSHEVCKSAFVNHLIKTEFRDTPINPTMMTLIETSVSETIGCYGGDMAAIEAGYPCDGDSGGPVVAKDSGTIIGVTSFGAELCGTTPNYYTRVSDYAEWIRAQIIRRRRNKCSNDLSSIDDIFSRLPSGSPSRKLALNTATITEPSSAMEFFWNSVTSTCKSEFDAIDIYLTSPRPATSEVRERCGTLVNCLDRGPRGNATDTANIFLHAFPAGITDAPALTYAQKRSVSRLLLCTSEYEGYYRSFELNLGINESYMSSTPASNECAAVTI